jgi:uncharacterized protein (DUF2236 family)
VLLTNVVVRLLPFQRTTDEATKFVPVAVSVNAPLPTAAVLGAMELRVGTGLLWAAAEPKLAPRTTSGPTTSTESRRLRAGWRFEMHVAAAAVQPTVRDNGAARRHWSMAQTAVFMAQTAVASLLGCRIDSADRYCRGREAGFGCVADRARR